MGFNMMYLNAVKRIFKTKEAYIFLVVMGLFGFAYGYFHGIQDNYLANIVHVNEFERGILEFFREMPGLLLVFILALFYKFNELNLLRISLIICIFGLLGIIMLPPEKVPVITFLVIFSIGDHMLMPSRSSIAMHSAKKGEEGLALGMVNSIGNFGRVVGYAIVAVLFIIFPKFNIAYISQFKGVFGISAFIMFTAVILITVIIVKNKNKNDNHVEVEKKKIYIDKKYKTYYILELFYGARKQVFLTFGPYVLILLYNANTKTIAALYTISYIASIATMPLIGKLIDKLGYKTIMVADTIILIFVCVTYGFAHKIFSPNIAFYVVCINFILDMIISQAAIASSVYVKDLSHDNSEVKATLTTGVSINHLVSVLIALLGGTIWKFFGVEVLFLTSALLGLCNSLFALTIKPVNKKLKLDNV